MATKFTPAQRKAAKKDDAMDKKRGIKENSPQDMAMDAKSGIPMGLRNGGKVGRKKGR